MLDPRLARALPTTDAIHARRSLRDGYADRDVPPEIIDRIIGCGLRAPSSKDAQPWCFHVVTRRSLLQDISRAVRAAKELAPFVPIDPATGLPREQFTSTVVESADVLLQVPLGIFVENRGEFSDGRRALSGSDPAVLPNALLGYGLEVLGIGAAVENLWLAAEAHGLRGVFIGDVLVVEDEIRALLSIDGDLMGVLALGIPNDPGPPLPKRLKPGRVRRYD